VAAITSVSAIGAHRVTTSPVTVSGDVRSSGDDEFAGAPYTAKAACLRMPAEYFSLRLDLGVNPVSGIRIVVRDELH